MLSLCLLVRFNWTIGVTHTSHPFLCVLALVYIVHVVTSELCETTIYGGGPVIVD